MVWSCGEDERRIEVERRIDRGNACIWRGRVQSQVGSQERPGLEVVKNDMKGLGLANALDRHAWRRNIVGKIC